MRGGVAILRGVLVGLRSRDGGLDGSILELVDGM